MLITQYFVEFIFYSFLGWVWESIYCTAKEKKWADRGFLFGPICPIYGSCVVVASFVFNNIPVLSEPDFPIWAIFIICCIGSAVAEFGTSWVLEKRFHARWWDYSNVPLNIQGRICVPVSIAFGLAGILVVKFLIPNINNIHEVIPAIVYEISGIVLAMLFGADFALTEASLSALLKDVESMHEEFNIQAQQNYEKITAAQSAVSERIRAEVTSIETKVNMEKETMEARILATRKRISEIHAGGLSFNQKRILTSIKKFTSEKNKTLKQNTDKQALIANLKEALVNKAQCKKEPEEE
ncbi:putative ABC transporter permease [Butyrivibrio sp. VCD2006]|uniref:putative ABC transporter permease n=1 Tax=Butyrivibrio sp. VCD2006 TaxID=1280664 RepID=UPI00041711DF|nr:putative ABC transporter permease [Butyrivibrio sp. VCD2006]